MSELMLSDRLKNCTWTLINRQSNVSSRGGKAQVVDYGRPFWSIDFRYENLGDSESRALGAWLRRRRGAAVPFTAYRPSSPSPLADPAAKNSGLSMDVFDESAGVAAMLGGASKNLGIGDMVSWRTLDDGYFVGEITSDPFSAGSAAFFRTDPSPLNAGSPHETSILKSVGLFRMNPASLQIQNRYDRFESVAFTARQVEP